MVGAMLVPTVVKINYGTVREVYEKSSDSSHGLEVRIAVCGLGSVDFLSDSMDGVGLIYLQTTTYPHQKELAVMRTPKANT